MAQGRKLDDETKRKISEAGKGKTRSDETKKNISEALKKYFENKKTDQQN